MVVERLEPNPILLSDHKPMTFVVHLTFSAFFKALIKGCTVYAASYSLGREPKKLFIILTSDKGVAGGPIHAIKLGIKTEGSIEQDDDKLSELVQQVRQQVQDFLVEKGLVIHPNSVLLTPGLEESLDHWENREMSTEEISKILEAGREVELGVSFT